MTAGTFNTPRRSNCQAKAVHAGTTQDAVSVGGTLLAGIISNVDNFTTGLAVEQWTIFVIHDTCSAIMTLAIKGCIHPHSAVPLQ